MVLMGITAIIITLFFLSIVGTFFVEGTPPDDTVNDENNVIQGMEEKYGKFKRKEKIKRIAGYLVAFLVICFSLMYVNLQAAVLGEGPTKIWFLTFIFGALNDIFIVQPLKCLLYYICTRQTFLRILFDVCSGALNIGSGFQIY